VNGAPSCHRAPARSFQVVSMRPSGNCFRRPFSRLGTLSARTGHRAPAGSAVLRPALISSWMTPSFKPISVDPGRPIQRGDLRPHRLWLVDGRARFRRWRDDERTGTTAELRELLDVPARVRHMDELGVEVQVLYPTFLLGAPSPVPEVELAIFRSYNRWLADRTAETNGRLRWVLMPPLRSMEEALAELRWGKEHGAVGVFKRAIECDGKRANDPYFYPLYEEAMQLDLPICIHTGGEDFTNPEAGNVRGFGGALPANITYFSALAAGRVPDRFPSLRFGVIEAMASWVPYVIADFKAKYLYSGGHRANSDHPIDLSTCLPPSSRVSDSSKITVGIGVDSSPRATIFGTAFC